MVFTVGNGGMDPYSSPYIIPNSSPHNPFPLSAKEFFDPGLDISGFRGELLFMAWHCLDIWVPVVCSRICRLPRGPKVVPFWGSYIESYKVTPKWVAVCLAHGGLKFRIQDFGLLHQDWDCWHRGLNCRVAL